MEKPHHGAAPSSSSDSSSANTPSEAESGSGSGIASASCTAASISSLTEVRTAPTSTPSDSRRRAWRSIGSFARHSSICACGTYFMSSCAAWPCMRMVTASSSVGPSPASARSRASRVASNIASGSLPSTLTPGKP